jgi:ParB family chromosome partitioning protein
MSKNFDPRVSRRERKVVEFDPKLYRNFDAKLLEGAKLEELKLTNVVVKDQVRTKFNEASIRDLAKNIEVNGLIQPLVVHREGNKFVLICGERRFRAMQTIPFETAPCFVLENKTQQELMAIQFSENSSREELHYIDKADGISNYQNATNASERKICQALAISKSEVHRSLLIANLPNEIKEAAKTYDIEKYVLLEFDAISDSALKKKIQRQLLIGEITKRADLKRIVKAGGLPGQTLIAAGKKAPRLPTNMTANAFLKVMQTRARDLDPESQRALQDLVDEARDLMKD